MRGVFLEPREKTALARVQRYSRSRIYKSIWSWSRGGFRRLGPCKEDPGVNCNPPKMHPDHHYRQYAGCDVASNSFNF